VKGWLAKIDVRDNGGIELDPDGFIQFDGMRPHQVHLEGGDASSDSYCFS
jgi:selenium-binding protein 1